MKKTILLLALIAGGGYYLHWYTFSTQSVGDTEHVHVIIDKNKIQQDEQRALEKLRGTQGQVEGQLLEDAKQRVESNFGAAGDAPAVQVVEQPNGYSPRNNYPPQSGYAPQGNDAPPAEYAPQGGAAPQQDPYADPQPSSPPRRRPARTASQDLDRGFQ